MVFKALCFEAQQPYSEEQSTTVGAAADAIRGLAVITTHGQYFIQFMASESMYWLQTPHHLLLLM